MSHLDEIHPDNPVLKPWTGPHGGAPPFGEIRAEHFIPALEAAMAEKRAEVAAIAANPEPADFDNTLRTLEASGAALTRARRLLGIYASTMSSPEVREAETWAAPRLAALEDEIAHDASLFARVRRVYEEGKDGGLDPEQQRLAFVIHDRFERRGAALAPPAKARLAEINQKLAELYTRFSQNVLADEEAGVLWLETQSDLEGLGEAERQAAAAEAVARGRPGAWAIANTRSAIEPFLTFSARRELREKALRLFLARSDGGAHDNSGLIPEILALRAEKARLLGRPSFAHLVADGQMARTPEAALKLLRQVWGPALTCVADEVAEMEALAAAEGFNAPLEAWDYRYWGEKVRKQKHGLDENEVKPYLALERLVEGMFWAAGELFGLKFEQVRGLGAYHRDVSVFEVTRDGARVGLWWFDPYARPGKRSGAWMSEYRTQDRLGPIPTTPIVSNNENFIRPAPGEPCLISWTDAVTLFHEFGHGLHGLNSAVTYPSLAGTAVLRDFVELPSQLFEHWLPTRELLGRHARHCRSGEPIPAVLVDKLIAAETFHQGFKTTEYLACALFDMEAHLADGPVEAAAFERQVLARIGMPREVALRHRPSHFLHMFSGESYAAGYYNYIWADTLSADAAEVFARSPGGFYDRDLAERLLKEILSVGNAIEPAEAYRRFAGRDPGVEALMRDRGLAADA